MYEIEEYVTSVGVRPFAEWLKGLRDIHAKKKILARLRRASLGNLGDWKSLEKAKGVFEMREHHGPGYRIFFSFCRQKDNFIVSRIGQERSRQGIAKATRYLADYQRRKNHETQ